MLYMRKAPPGPVRLALVFVVLVGASQLVAGPLEAATADDIEPALRDLWSRGSERFQRQWLIAGPVSEAVAAGVDAASAQPAAGQPLADEGPRWRPHVSWGDVIDLNEVLGPRLERRAGWKLRRAPAPDYVAPPAALEAGAGSYELFPGVLLTVTNQDGQLTLQAPGQPEVALISESETAFGHPWSGGAIEFVRDADGRVTGVELEGFGQAIFARRLQ